MLHAEVNACGADLIVAGCYGHTRVGEWVFGGVSRDLLRARRSPSGSAAPGGRALVHPFRPVAQRLDQGHREQFEDQAAAQPEDEPVAPNPSRELPELFEQGPTFR